MSEIQLLLDSASWESDTEDYSWFTSTESSPVYLSELTETGLTALLAVEAR